MTDDIWTTGRRETRRQAAVRIMTDLQLGTGRSDPPEVAARKARETAERLAQHDAYHADDFLRLRGAPRPISKGLATQLGYSVQQVRWAAGSDAEYHAWRAFYAGVSDLAGVVAPTLLSPLPTERAIRDQVDPDVWRPPSTTPTPRGARGGGGGGSD